MTSFAALCLGSRGRSTGLTPGTPMCCSWGKQHWGEPGLCGQTTYWWEASSKTFTSSRLAMLYLQGLHSTVYSHPYSQLRFLCIGHQWHQTVWRYTAYFPLWFWFQFSFSFFTVTAYVLILDTVFFLFIFWCKAPCVYLSKGIPYYIYIYI